MRLAVAALAAPALVSCTTTDEEDPYSDPYYGGGAGAGDYVQVTPTGQQGGGYGAQQPDYGDQAGNQPPTYEAPTYQQPTYQAPTYQAPTYQQPAYQEPAPTNTGGGGTYTVQRGDTLYAISSRHGITVGQLMSANGLTSDQIFPGNVLRIP